MKALLDLWNCPVFPSIMEKLTCRFKFKYQNVLYFKDVGEHWAFGDCPQGRSHYQKQSYTACLLAHTNPMALGHFPSFPHFLLWTDTFYPPSYILVLEHTGLTWPILPGSAWTCAAGPEGWTQKGRLRRLWTTWVPLWGSLFFCLQEFVYVEP